ncbi:MAG: hypothetical protein FJ148_28780 [Deltaproteobacteria bacterium]|nr:hypothetical protein [Deltaproteobacteria bacterium]
MARNSAPARRRLPARTATLLLLAALPLLPLACSDATNGSSATSEDACASAPVRGAGFDV